jgi:8-oxo-dGTP pyrophosphatase MutT (NUDIX family)
MRYLLENKIERLLAKRHSGILDKEDYYISAVLLPLVETKNETSLLFEVRAQDLDVQPGEVCFPGGGVEFHELDRPYEAAIRETSEELGISREDIKLLGALDVLPTPMGKLIYPFIGKMLTAKIVPNKEEVDKIFTVPLSFLINNPPARSYTDVATQYCSDFPFSKIPPTYKKTWQKRWSLPIYYLEYDKFFIWGITAKILNNFLKLCRPAFEG